MSDPEVRRVLMVIHAPGWGGIHGIAERIAPECAKAGYPWVVVLPKESDPECAERLRAAGIEVVLIPLRRIRKTRNLRIQLTFLGTIPIDVWRLTRLVRKHRISVIMVGGAHHFHSALAAKLTRRRLVWQLHSDQLPAGLRRMFTPWIVRLANAVMTSGHSLVSAYPGLEKAANRTVGFRAPVDIERFRFNADARKAARAEIGISEDEVVVGTVGGRGPNKNHELLIEATIQAEQKAAGLRPLICGAALPQHADYYSREVIVPAETHWPGKTLFFNPGRNVDHYFNAFDIFCLPSRGEGASLVVAEAMATGLPIVANEVGALPESITHGKTGFLVHSSSAEEMAGYLARLAENPQLRKGLGEAGRAFAEKNMSIKACTRQHVLACEIALGLKPQRPPSSG